MSSTHDQWTQQGENAAGQPAGQQAGQPAGQPASQPASQYVPRPSAGYDTGYDSSRYSTRGPSGAAIGWTAFAAVVMMISGIWNFLDGLAAIIKGGFFVQLPNYAYNISVSGWGWLHLILGIVVFLAGACLFLDMAWARAVGVVLAVFSAIANFLYIPYTPVWSIVVIALDVFVIWALLAPRQRLA
jgi:hypothetical protein